MSQDDALAFRALHAGPKILILPNAWDAASAALMADAGAKAVATSSAAVAWSHGYPDGDALPAERLIATLECVVEAIDAPVSADIEGGYSDDPAEVGALVAQVIDAGVVGINMEDGQREPELLCAKIAAAREAAERAEVDLFINARTDVYLHRLAEGEAALAEALRRAEMYAKAGADGIFVPGPTDPELIARLVAGIEPPLNVMGRAGAPTAAELEALGVRRLSSATGPFRAAYAALAKAMAGFMTAGDAAALAALGQGLPDLNTRFSGR
ncbi:isocitrate lyase/phosphoenolpyruvate mutase family protein [Phenylobacterium sp.]|uniref:isocitrate lyase/PEP mutase family protein n=1 Tax=Phenylobacterium sp. TaxID=1871053 RepID=UPI0035B0AF48